MIPATFRYATTAMLVLLAPDLAHAQGEVIVVDDSPDFADFGGARRVADLPGPDGRVTFREAVIAANNTPGPQTIHFNIPQSRWWSLFPNKATIFSDTTPFLITDDSTTIDGRSQTAFTGDTNPDGNEVAFWGEHPNSLGAPMITLYSSANVVVGLDEMRRRGYGISIATGSDGNHIYGNTISAPLYAAVRIEGSFNVIGGTAAGEANRLSSGNDGVRVESSFQGPPPTGNRIIGNELLTGSASGVQVRAGAVGTIIGGHTPAERNVIARAGRFGEEGFPTGDQVLIWNATDTVVQGNFIGTDATGNAVVVQVGPSGVQVRDSDRTVIRNNVIGGIRVEGRNHHSGQFFGWAIELEGTSDGTIIAGNSIGVGADGSSPIPNLYGIRTGFWPGSGSPTATRIGGLEPGSGNVVANNERDGVTVDSQTRGVAILGNSMFNDGQEGIDLSPAGPTANDPLDADEGANRLQNHPVIDDATLSGGALAITYTVDTAPTNAAYPLRVEFFLADASSQEGEVFLGSDVYPAPGSRSVTLDATGSGTTIGSAVLGTATDAEGNSSEFGAPEEVAAGTSTHGEPTGPTELISLGQPAPNPAAREALVSVMLDRAQSLTVAAFDVTGRRVATLHMGPAPAGAQTLAMAVDALPAGVYLIRAVGDAGSVSRTLTVARGGF